jgi:8-oxo-dGTP pyrophosphatase MutT (NUDIX family)
LHPAEAEHRLRQALSGGGEGSSDFDLNPGVQGTAASLRPAAVLVPVDLTGPVARVMLTKRAAHLKHHPGQVAFPGGKQDQADPDLTATALREAAEEIGLPAGAAQVIGHLPPHRTITAFQVMPVVALIHQPFTARIDPDEVDELFAVPLSYLADPGSYRIENRVWQGQMRRYYAVPWGPYYIWGATARILRGLADRVAHAH